MKTTLITITKVSLDLSPKDAYLLKAYVQNPMTTNENEETREFREKLFNALPSFDLLMDLED